jgi:phage-related minor tail protein
VTDNFMTAFDSIIAGTDSVGRAFTRMVGSILADIGRMMAAEAMKKFVMQILGSAFSAASPSLSTQNGGAFDEFGNEYSPLYDTLPGQASGGFVGGRNAFMIGERGPEMFVPTTSGNIITAQRSGGGASVNGVTINVNGAQDPARTAREVKAALMSMLSSDPAARQRLRVVASGGGVA